MTDDESKERLLREIEDNQKVFTLLSGKEDALWLLEKVTKLPGAEYVLGYELSYPREEIVWVEAEADPRASEDAKAHIEKLSEGLYVASVIRR